MTFLASSETGLKRCCGCKSYLRVEWFGRNKAMPDGLQAYCKICRKARGREERAKYLDKHNSWYAAHREGLLAYKKEHRNRNKAKYEANKKSYYKNNAEQIKLKVAAWQKRNPEKVRAHRRKSGKKYYENNPSARVARNLRNRIRQALHGSLKSATTLKLVGCGLSGLVTHLESGFTGGMSWLNYGSLWEIDHILPCSSFDLTLPEEQRKCFHYSNLRPLPVSENRSKNDFLPDGTRAREKKKEAVI